MKTRILHFFEIISANFWMIPLLSLILGAGLAILNFYLDKTLYARHIELPGLYLYFNNSQNIRTLLSTSASSLLGVAGVSFSITIASLTLASQQFGPRLIRNFMLDRFNQVVLGCFIGTFLYCILMLQFTSSMDLEKTTPFVSMVGLLVLIVINLLMLVFFIHHIAVSIQADSVISDVDRELMAQMNYIFSDKFEKNSQPVKLKLPPNLDKKFEEQGLKIHSLKSGYLQAIDLENLIEYVTNNDCATKFLVKPGEFIIQGSVIAYLLRNEHADDDKEAEEKIESEFIAKLIIGDVGTSEQDPEFAIRQLVEVAVRALSPGINDPFTAVSCINRLGNNIAYLMDRQFPEIHHIDESGHLRVQLKPFTFKGIVEASFNQIRQHGESDVAVTIHLLNTLDKLILQARTTEQAEALNTQSEAISSEKQDRNIAAKDQKDITELYDEIDNTLKQKKADKRT